MNRRVSMSSPIIFWFVVVGCSLSWNLKTTEKSMDQTVINIGRSFFKEIKTARLWNARHGSVYVPITEKTQPNPYLDDPNRDVITSTGLTLTKVNPAFMTRQIAEIAAQESNIQYHITSLKPIRPENKADQWEITALKKFESGEGEFFQFIQEAMLYRYMAPLSVKEACLKCHAKQGYALGDIRGGISVSIPAEVYIDAINTSKTSVTLIHLITLIAGVGFFYFLSRYRDEKEQKINEKNLELEKEIEDRKKIQAALVDSEKRFRQFYEYAPLPYQSLDYNGYILEVNPAWLDALGGYTKDEVIGKSIGDFLPPEWMEHFKKVLK